MKTIFLIKMSASNFRRFYHLLRKNCISSILKIFKKLIKNIKADTEISLKITYNRRICPLLKSLYQEKK